MKKIFIALVFIPFVCSSQKIEEIGRRGDTTMGLHYFIADMWPDTTKKRHDTLPNITRIETIEKFGVPFVIIRPDKSFTLIGKDTLTIVNDLLILIYKQKEELEKLYKEWNELPLYLRKNKN